MYIRSSKDGSNEGIRDAAEAKATGEPVGQTSASTLYFKRAFHELDLLVGEEKGKRRPRRGQASERTYSVE